MRTGQKPKKNQVQEALNYYPKNSGSPCLSVDVALFGRMVAKAPELNADASAQVAHAISTHKVETEFDFFTAGDDRASDDNAGAGMMGTVEFNSSTLYRYATVAAHELCVQLAGDADAAAKVAAEFVRAFVRSMPDGRINSHANNTLPDAVYVALRNDQPVNFVGAFENPVRSTDGYVAASIERLKKYTQGVYGSFASKPEQAYVVTLDGGLEGLGDVRDFDGLLKNIESDVKGALR
jgi:CRISPR system Cascade subunit CasC